VSEQTEIRCSECGHAQWIPSLTELALFTLHAFGWKRVTAPTDSDGLIGVCDDCFHNCQPAASAGGGAAE